MFKDTSTAHTATALAVVAICIVAGSVPLAAAAPDDTEQTDSALIVQLHGDGSADVSLRLTFDLTTDGERKAFQQLETDEQARENITERYHDRMQSVATATEAETGRSMEVTDSSMTTETVNDGTTGVVHLTVSWSNLATVQGDSLVLQEPFTDGFTPTEDVVVRAPDGYAIADTSPTPESTGDGEVRWDETTDFTEFSVTAEKTAPVWSQPIVIVPAGLLILAGVGIGVVHLRRD